MTDQPTTGTTTAPTNPNSDGPEMGTFDAEGAYEPKQITSDDLGDVSFEDAVTGTIVEFEDGDIVKGIIVRVDRDEVLLDIGFKSEGVIPARELSIRQGVDPSEIVSVGEETEALVLQKEDKEGRLVLSKKRAQYERAWGNIEQVKETNGVVSGPVIEVVKGGLIVDIGLRGFLPASLVELRRVRDLQPYVGRKLEAKIIELDKNRNNVVLSRRAWLEETQKEQREEFLEKLQMGEMRKGVVSSVVNFGAFVDIGGMDGLVHVSELSWKHVDHPSSVVAVGDEVDVQIIDVDLDKERISLSLKATQQDPWQEFANAHRVGELVYARVTKLVPFGAFAQVGEGIEGLVHISEMAAHHVELPEQVVSAGEEMWVKIIEIDLQRRRISLSIKQAAEGGEVAEEYREHFGEHAYDDAGNYIGPINFEPETESQAAWADFAAELGENQVAEEPTAASEALDQALATEPASAEPAVEESAESGTGEGVAPSP
ncbi:MAG: 30S ribosomal protein S1 [Actinobacteria bacterium]|nr:30S ribosomal protein S1 [Actinomycetota bacterium]